MMEIQERLGLYQVFVKLYEHNRSLLDDILQLENISNQTLTRSVPLYIMGILQDHQVYLLSNLSNHKSQKMVQPQGVWTIGRASYAGIQIFDQRLSRLHAMIQYIEHEGFYLSDLSSTNGTFVNHELIYEPILLTEGDHIRLGSISFSFFLCQSTQTLKNVPSKILRQLNDSSTTDLESITNLELDTKETDSFPKHKIDAEKAMIASSTSALLAEQQSKILDRYFGKINNPE